MAHVVKSSVKNSNTPKIKDLSAQQRRLALIKQQQCDSIALHIVTKLIECQIEEDAFLLSLKYLNQCHYEDIVEERVLGKLCGYPVCGNLILDMPQKKFHISSKLNKIYDITDRKNYCSNFCYKAGNYIKDQMLTSPLWFRDKEQIPDFHLLPKTDPGSPGIEIDHGIAKVDPVDKPIFTPVSTFAHDVLDDMSEDIRDTINVECEITQNNTNITTKNTEIPTNTNNEQSLLIDPNPIGSNFYAKFQTPNLADILKENAEYFVKKSDKSKLELNQTAAPTKVTKTDNKIEPSLTQTPKIAAKFQNQSVNKKKEFNRTIINTGTKLATNVIKNINRPVENLQTNVIKSNNGFDSSIINNAKIETLDDQLNTSSSVNIKGILSNRKISIDNSENQKKSVSFSKETKPESKDNTVFGYNTSKQKYKVAIIDDTKDVNSSKIENNINLISNVQENPNISKTKYVVTNIDDIDVIHDVTHDITSKTTTKNINLLGDIYETPKIYKSNLDNNKNVEDLNMNEHLDNKTNRLNRLKNSSTYRRNHQFKMIQKPVKYQSDFKERLKNSVEKWVTLESIIFLYGEEKVKEIISDKTFKKYVNKKKALNLDEVKQKKYDDLCKRLNLMELADRKFDESITGKKRLPIPKFEELKEQAESLDLKVQAFYSGCCELIEEDGDSETESMREEVEEPYNGQGTPAVLPLIESKDIVATRRKIFLTSLSRTIPSTCEILKQCPNYLLSDIKQLIDTFEFTADNIVFKSAEWKFVALILIKMLAIRDEELQETFTCADAQSYINSLKKEFFITDLNEFLFKTIEIQTFLEECGKNIDYLY